MSEQIEEKSMLLYPVEEVTAEHAAWIGAQVQVETVVGKTYEGHLYSMDPSTGSLFLMTSDADLQLLVGENIRAVTRLQQSTFTVPRDDSRGGEANLDSNALKMKNDVKDKLSKLRVPFRDDGPDLIILGQVTLPPPYTADACSSVNSIVLSRVRSLLQS